MDRKKAYWNANLRYLVILVLLWFIVGQVLPILAYDFLNQFRIGGFPLGLWFSFQGSILLFVLLLFVYNYLMNRLDKKFGIEE